MVLTITDILLSHQWRYPLWQVDDVYKLLHQSVMGSEHAISSPEKAAQWLTNEIASLQPREGDLLLDPISSEGEMLRVHLRPYLAHGFAEKALLEAFIKTANTVRGEPEGLEDHFNAALDLARSGGLSFAALELESFFKTMRAAGFRAVHHSSVYEKEYSPAYRVIAKEFLPVEMQERLEHS